MNSEDLLALISALGGLSGLGALIAAYASWQNSKELKPDHGNSLADKHELTLSMVKSLGHQIGEMRREMHAEKEDIQALREDKRYEHERIWDAINKHN